MLEFRTIPSESNGELYRTLGDYLQDPCLLFEIFILIRLGIRKVVNFDSMFIDLIQDLTRRARKQQQSPLKRSAAGVSLTETGSVF